MRGAKYTERQVIGHVLALLGPGALKWYVTEVAGEGLRNRGTAGFADLVGLMRDPTPYVLMVETKGRTTDVGEEQWRFGAYCALVGQPYLIVRSPGALLNGLRYLALMPERLRRMPDYFWDQWDMTEWPENVWYLERMRDTFVEQRALAVVSDITLPGPDWAASRKHLPPRHREPPGPPWPIGPEWSK